MSSAVVPHIANMLLSTRLLNLKRGLAERKRKRTQQPHLVTVYLAINDAYSYLLIQVLDDLQKRYQIEFDFRCVLKKQSQMYPAEKLWDKNAFNDGQYLSDLYQLDFPEHNPKNESFAEQVTAQLLHWELQPGFLKNALPLFKAYWQGDERNIEALINPALVGHVECYEHHLLNNESMLKDNGHYLSAMLHYGGEWYWGLDRLQYLEKRFNDLHLSRDRRLSVKFNLAHTHFCQLMSNEAIKQAGERGLNTTPIEMYWSIRSPYSYIALLRTRQLASHYGVELVVKPVLPMVMRRMQVPTVKRFYISQDAKREAKQYGIEFGKIADPLGKGVERCYALYEYAKQQGKALEYLESYARGVWAEGIRSDTDAGLQKIVSRSGLDWQEAKTMLMDKRWQVWAQNNLAQLYGNDLWGVPSFIYKDVKAFGQDRVDLIERRLVTEFSLSDVNDKVVN